LLRRGSEWRRALPIPLMLEVVEGVNHFESTPFSTEKKKSFINQGGEKLGKKGFLKVMPSLCA
jgi:hypothetical protein